MDILTAQSTGNYLLIIYYNFQLFLDAFSYLENIFFEIFHFLET